MLDWLPPPAVLARVAGALRVGVMGFLVLGMLAAPLVAWIHHRRLPLLPTRRSLLLATLAVQCPALGALGSLAAMRASSRGIHILLAAAPLVGLFALPLLLWLADLNAGSPPSGRAR